MARGRMISRTLGSSRCFANLAKHAGKLTEFTQALYPMIVVHSDDHGRQAGDAFTIKHAVWPTSPRQEAEFEAALVAMERADLIERYTVGGTIYLQILGFDEHQPGLTKRTASKFPEPTGNSREPQEVTASRARAELNLTELNRTELNSPTTAVADPLAGFDAFWEAYPKKAAKADAQKAWRQVAPSAAEQAAILTAVARQRQTNAWLKEDGEYIPHPAGYLRKRRWEDSVGLHAATPVVRCKRRHRPPHDCTDDAACTRRYLDEQRGAPPAVAS